LTLLLDTHVLLWFLAGDPRLSSRARSAIEDLSNKRLFSIASAWEISLQVVVSLLRRASDLNVLSAPSSLPITMMHRLILALLAIAVLAPGGARAQETAIFREVNFAPYALVALGEPFTADSIATRRPGGFYQLRPGTYGGADSVEVLLIDDRVAAIRFTYSPVAEHFEYYVARYTGAFGEPERRTDRGETGRIEYATWRDGRTGMELRLAVEGERVEFTAMLADRGLMDSGQ
jgi:hypothetical protein